MMACGLGACLCCVEKTVKGNVCVCTEGPVFNIESLTPESIKMANLSVNIGKLQLSNPVMTASGTFGYGEEFTPFIDINRLGAYIIKGTTLNHREGNDYPRMVETPSGMLNAVGLQNKGVDYFIEHIYPRICSLGSKLIVNVSGANVDDYAETARRLHGLDDVSAIEVNISCPNVKEGGMAFGALPQTARQK